MQPNHIVSKKLSQKEWLETRKRYVTATEIPCLLGLNPWKSAGEMWRDKTDGVFVENAHVLAGQWLEPTVVAAANYYLNEKFKLYEQEEGKKLLFINEELRCGATPDAYNEDMLLECKTTGSANMVRYCAFAPDQYICQLMVQLMMTGKKEGRLAILDANMNSFKESNGYIKPAIIYKVDRSSMLEELIVSELARFWNCLETGKMFRVVSKVKNWAKLACMTCQGRIL